MPASAISSRTSTLGRWLTPTTVRERAETVRSEVEGKASRLKTLLFEPLPLWCGPLGQNTDRTPFLVTESGGARTLRRSSSEPRVSTVREAARRDWELVLKRNPVERLKQEKAPLGIRDELPALIAAGLRERRRGGHRPAPVVGPLPRQAEDRDVHAAREGAGRASSRRAELRAIGEVSNRYGRGDGELSTRQNIQLHWLELGEAARRLRRPRAPPGVTTAGGCGDTVRNITGCPVQGIAADELFDATADRRRGGRLLLRQPRLREPAAQAQVLDLGLRRPLQRARDQLHLARRRDPRRPRGLRRARRRRALVGAADRPRHGRVRPEGGGDRDPRRDHERLVGRPQVPRLAREGAAQVHGRRHRPGGHARARRGAASAARSRTTRCRRSTSSRRTTSASTPQQQDGLSLHRRARPPRADLGRPDDRGSPTSPSRFGGDVRITRQQNFIVTGVPTAGSTRRSPRARRDRLPARRQPGARQLDRLHRRAALQLLGRRDEDAARPADRPARGALRRRRSPSCGCTSTAARTRAPSTGSATSASRARPRATRAASRRQAYDIFVRGGLGPGAADRQAAVPARADRRARRAPSTGSSRAGSTSAARARAFVAFARRLSDEELGALAGLEPARDDERDDEEAAE